MTLVTKMIETNEQVGTLAWAINTGIRRSINIDDFKKTVRRFSRKVIRKGSIEEYLIKNKACLIASSNEIYNWIKINSPKDERRNSTWMEDDTNKFIWIVDFNIINKSWTLLPLRRIGKYTPYNWNK